MSGIISVPCILACKSAAKLTPKPPIISAFVKPKELKKQNKQKLLMGIYFTNHLCSFRSSNKQ